MAAPSSNDIANALRYGPQTQVKVRRSQYLSDALKQLGQGSDNIRSPGELAAKLLATAILHRTNDKAQSEMLAAIKADRNTEADALVAALRPPKPVQPPVAPAMAPQPPQDPAATAPTVPSIPPPAPVQQQPLPPPQPSPQPAAAPQIDPELDAVVRTVWGEARGEDPQGQAAVAGVILNRAKERGLKPRDVVLQPGQFEPWGNPQTRAQMEALDPSSPEYQAILQNIAPALSGQNPVGGADHFYSPGAQTALGRQPPSWDNGSGQDLGRHRFFDLEQPKGGAEMQPFQLAANQMQPGMIPSEPPSAPGSSPPAAGTAPGAQAPQASAPGATPQWPTYQPTEAEVNFIEGLLRDPRTFEQGRAEAMKLRQKMSQPAEAEIQNINGVPFYVSKVPGQGGQPVMIPIPQEAMTQVMAAQQAGLPGAPQGLNVQRDPLGNLKEAPGAPPEGYNANPNGTLAPRQGGPADPYRTQAPPANYRYSQGGALEPIPNSPADIQNNPTAKFDATKGIRAEIAPIVAEAIAVKRNIDAVRAGAAQNNGAGDIAIVNGIQRLIDDGVVREGDVALQLKAQGIQGSLGGLLAYAQSSGKFDPATRKKLADTAEALYTASNATMRQRVLGYRPIADGQLGPGTFDNFVLPPDTARQLGWMEDPQVRGQPQPQQAAPTFQPGTPDAALVEAMKRGLRLSPQQQQRARDLGLVR